MKLRRFLSPALGRAALAAGAGLAMAFSLAGTASAKADTAQDRQLGTRYVFATLTGTELPNGGDPYAYGHVVIRIRPQAGQLCATLRVRYLYSPVTRVGIYRGWPGRNGPLVVPLPRPIGGFSHRCIGVNPVYAARLAQQPRGYYVLLQTREYPSGAVRGQLHHSPDIWPTS